MGSAAPRSAGAAAAAAAQAEAALSRLPPRLRQWVVWLLSHYPGRIVLRTAATCIRIELFDRSMTVAAQFFTSVFPILILVSTWSGGANTDAIESALSMPEETTSILDDAAQGGAAFGIVGTLMVLASATSLSRALTRAFSAVWKLPRPKTRLTAAWRWLAVVLALALSVVVVSALTGAAAKVPPEHVWQLAVSLTCDTAIAVFVPWVLLSGVLQPRHLVPGALIFGLVMLVVRPATGVWLPRALEVSADRYGPIGVAFTYLAWLYIVSFCFLAAAALGHAIATDRGGFGTRIRGRAPVPSPATGG